jgi:hypothetical protein
MLGHLLCALMFGLGHLVRDGTPAWERILAPLVGTRFEPVYHLKTHLARLTGALVCGYGAVAVYGMTWLALALTAAVLVGFYVDQQHGEANMGATEPAIISGTTSVAPAGVVFFFAGHLLSALFLVFVVSLAKPAIWKLAYRFVPDRLYPTRVAAAAFGCLLGGAV